MRVWLWRADSSHPGRLSAAAETCCIAAGMRGSAPAAAEHWAGRG